MQAPDSFQVHAGIYAHHVHTAILYIILGIYIYIPNSLNNNNQTQQALKIRHAGSNRGPQWKDEKMVAPSGVESKKMSSSAQSMLQP